MLLIATTSNWKMEGERMTVSKLFIELSNLMKSHELTESEIQLSHWDNVNNYNALISFNTVKFQDGKVILE